MKMRQTIQVAAVLLILSLTGCGYYSKGRGNEQETPSTFDSAKTLGYGVAQVILQRNRCLACHSDQGGNADGINLESYANVYAVRVRIKAAAVDSDEMPLSPPPMPAADKEVLGAWIEAGAPEFSQIPLSGNEPSEPNPPPPGPQPQPEPPPPPQPEPEPAIDFALVSARIFQPYCVRCHGRFNEYARVAVRLEEIQSAVDSNAMPKDGPALSDELKDLLAEWIDMGAPESGSGPAPQPPTPPPTPTPPPCDQQDDDDHPSASSDDDDECLVLFFNAKVVRDSNHQKSEAL